MIKAKDKDRIVTDEVISIINKEKIRNNVERNSNIKIKSNNKNIINKDDTSAIVDIEKVSKISIEECLSSANNQTTNILSSTRDSIETKNYNILYILLNARKRETKENTPSYYNITLFRRVTQKSSINRLWYFPS